MPPALASTELPYHAGSTALLPWGHAGAAPAAAGEGGAAPSPSPSRRAAVVREAALLHTGPPLDGSEEVSGPGA